MNGGSFASVALLSGKSGADIRDKVSRDVAPTWLTGVCYWPFVMALTFRVVPLRHRALSSAGFGAVWHIYLSSQANKAPVEKVPSLARLTTAPIGLPGPSEGSGRAYAPRSTA
jgi:hypothetical protein